jgi:hypothetical protein
VGSDYRLLHCHVRGRSLGRQLVKELTMDDNIITRSYELLKKLPPLPYRIMASHAVPWPKTYRQWDTRGRLLLWVNTGAIYDLPRKNAKNVMFYDSFLSIEPIGIPVEFVSR